MQLRSTAIAVLGILALTGAGRAQEELSRPSRPLYTPETERTVDRALRWLANHQNKDGSWTARVGFKINDGYKLEPDRQPDYGMPHLGVTALAGMAFLSGGHLPGQGPYGDVMDKAVRFIIDNVNDDGFITAHGTRMYSHAFSLLFLAEVYGMTQEPKLREKLDLAVEFTHRSQNDKGGWRYAPLARDSDMSITVCQVVALREARNIGIKVPKATIEKALRYVMESAVVERGDRGSFLYQHAEVPFNRNSFALTAAGLTTMYQAGLYRDRDIDAFARKHKIRRRPRVRYCLEYLRNHYDQVWHEYHDHYFYYYGNYYAAQAMYALGGDLWRSWYRMVRNDLLSVAVTRDGKGGKEAYWRSKYVGDAFPTAVSAIILQVPNHYLPIFQR
ncbi:MAG: prenyltransferase/squalene oxidase repeat-containing protein [Planctomycetota bacterium]|jgi:hypothetical protein